MKIYIRSLILACSISSSFCVPWGSGSAYNPMGRGFLTNNGPSSPAFYNPGPGNLAPAFSYTQQPSYSQNNISNLSEKANKVIGRWTLMVEKLGGTPEQITDEIKYIKNILEMFKLSSL